MAARLGDIGEGGTSEVLVSDAGIGREAGVGLGSRSGTAEDGGSSGTRADRDGGSNLTDERFGRASKAASEYRSSMTSGTGGYAAPRSESRAWPGLTKNASRQSTSGTMSETDETHDFLAEQVRP